MICIEHQNEDREVSIAASKTAWLQHALDKRLTFQWKVSSQCRFTIQGNFLSACSISNFCSRLYIEGAYGLPWLLISCKYVLEKCHLCHDLSSLPDDVQLFCLVLGCALISEINDGSRSFSCSCT